MYAIGMTCATTTTTTTVVTKRSTTIAMVGVKSFVTIAIAKYHMSGTSFALEVLSLKIGIHRELTEVSYILRGRDGGADVCSSIRSSTSTAWISL